LSMIRLLVVAAALFSILILLIAPFAPLLPQNVMASPTAEQMPSPYDHIKLTTVPGTVGYKLEATGPEGAKFTSEVRLIPKVIPEAVYKLTAEDVERAKKGGLPVFGGDSKTLTVKNGLITVENTYFIPYAALSKEVLSELGVRQPGLSPCSLR
jgi:hypothetical protein